MAFLSPFGFGRGAGTSWVDKIHWVGRSKGKDRKGWGMFYNSLVTFFYSVQLLAV